jgi:hypothetical protein
MRSFEGIVPEALRPGPRLQPKRHGTILVPSDFVRISSNLVVVKNNPFGFTSRRFKQSIHIFDAYNKTRAKTSSPGSSIQPAIGYHS